MATDFKTIPIIDVSPLLAKCDDPKMGDDPGVSKVLQQLDQTCREAGFFYVKGHGIPETLVKEVKNIAHKFFHLPDEEKMKIKLTPAAGFRPLNPPNFKSLMEEYINFCTDLSRSITRGIALALGGSPYEFEGERAGDPFWVLRIIGYPGVYHFANAQEINDIGCGAHTDYGLLTLINQDDNVTALQVRNLSGEWIPVPPIPGSLICNICDMLQLYSNGLYKSTVHRVVNHAPKYRVCLAYFYETNYDAAVEPLDICKLKSGGTAKFERSAYGEHLVSKVKNNFAM